MGNEDKVKYATRASIEKLLTEDEVTALADAEIRTYLDDGDEFLDLEQLDKGVQRARSTTGQMACVLSRRSVRPESWSKILAHLATHVAAHPR